MLRSAVLLLHFRNQDVALVIIVILTVILPVHYCNCMIPFIDAGKLYQCVTIYGCI